VKQSLIAILLITFLTVSQAAGPALGVAMATGSFRIDGSQVSDNATLFGGSTIETEKASSRLQLSSGARIELAPGSRAKVYSDHLSLESGLGELASKEYQIEAKTLRIETDQTNSLARVKIESPKSVLVTAVNGSVRVYNEIGMLVANVNSGMAMAFQPQAAAPAASERSGCLVRSRDDPNKFILIDQVANVIVEVRGAGVAEQVGNQVKITGTTFRSVIPVPGASQIIQVTTIELVTAGGCGAVVAGGQSPNTSPTAPKTGISNGAKVVIAVAVVGGAAGGIVAATAGSKSR
jgi:hypothetical protein